MKKYLLSLLIILLTTIDSLAQSPEGFSYQAVIRDATNSLVSNQNISIRLSINQSSIDGTGVYSETFLTTTNVNGLINLMVGSGTTTDDFSIIDWLNGPYFLEVAVDLSGGTSFLILNVSQLMSVPYAQYAKSSGTGAGPQGPQGPQGPAGNDAVEYHIQAGLVGTSVNGTGTNQDPYVVSSKTYSIGYWAELGGYVFQISPDGRHGIVAEVVDQGYDTWAEAENKTTFTNTHSGNAQYFMDWRLPNAYELSLMMTYKNTIGGFVNGASYWSSTIYSSSNYKRIYTHNTDGTYNYQTSPTDSFYVRSIRTF